MNCIFCLKKGPYNTVEHIIPESLGNDDTLLINCVCDKCQNYFGKEIESFILQKTPFAFWRVWYGIKSKKGKFPSINFSLPKENKGRIPFISKYHDQKVGFTAHSDGSISVDLEDSEMIKNIIDGNKNSFVFNLSPKHLIFIGRFLGKMAIELLAHKDRELSLNVKFDNLRKYVRNGITKSIWPILNGQLIDRLDSWEKMENKNYESRTIYSYSIIEVYNHLIFIFDIGCDRWGIILNNQFPDPSIIENIKDDKCKNIKFIYYTDSEWQKSNLEDTK